MSTLFHLGIAEEALDAAEAVFNALSSKSDNQAFLVAGRRVFDEGRWVFSNMRARLLGDWSSDPTLDIENYAFDKADLTARHDMPSGLVVATRPSQLQSGDVLLTGGFTVPGSGIVFACSGIQGDLDEAVAAAGVYTAIGLIRVGLAPLLKAPFDPNKVYVP